MKFDDVLCEVGEFGKYQKQTFVLLLYVWIIHSPFMGLSVFVLAPPDHRCRIVGYRNDSYEIHGSYHQTLINKNIPPATAEDKLYDECHMYRTDQSKTLYDNDSHPINASVSKCSSWVYSDEVFESTFAEKVNLVCDDKYMISMTKTIFFGGVFVGSLVFGVISDILGRKKTLLVAMVLLFTSAMALAWSENYTMFAIIRFFTGVANAGLFVTTFVLGMEWVGPSKRTIVGLIIHLVGTAGYLYYTLASYLLRQWNYIIITLATPVGIAVVVWWFIPESPRWLCSKGKIEEARVLLRQVARVNGKDFPDKILDNITPERKESGKVWLLFSDRTLGYRSIVIFYNWMVACMVYYGLGLNTGILYGDYYVNFLISVLVEIPGHTLPLLMLDRFGRKKSHFIYMLVGGLACLSTIFTVSFGGKDLRYFTTALAMVGKMFATASFASIYVFSAELFPTAVRNAGMGTSSCLARVGGMISPFVANTGDLVGGKVGTAIPLVIFGGVCLLAAALTLTLPETRHQRLPETIQDSKDFRRKQYKEKIIHIQTVEDHYLSSTRM